MDKLKYASVLSLTLICTTILVVIANGAYVLIEGDVARQLLVNTTSNTGNSGNHLTYESF